MTTFQPTVILEELKNLVSYSCNDCTKGDSPFTSFHKGMVKIYFEARSVDIDYKNQIVKIDIPVTATEYTSVSFECLDLEKFFQSCIKSDKKSLMYYQNVLTYYSFLKVAS